MKERMTRMETISYTLNGTTFVLDKDTGVLMEMSIPGVAPFQKMREDGKAIGLVDLAWPVHYEYETLRANPTAKVHPCAPRFESGADHLNIIYDEMPQSYETPEIEDILKGRICVRIELRALEDGKSISLRCVVKNNSRAAVEQIVFPNFDSLTPTDTKDNAKLTMTGGVINPYTYICPRGLRGAYYSYNMRTTGLMLTPTGMQTGYMIGRWYDWGSFKGGFSMYRKHWGWDKENPEQMGEADPTYLRYDEDLDQFRLAGVHNVSVKPGETFDTGLYIMTPHTGCWIFGIGPFKEWYAGNVHRDVPTSRHSREMLGYQALTLTNYHRDPLENFCRYDYMPVLAADNAEHGITGMLVMKPFYYTLPLTKDCFYDTWGGLDAWKENVRKCRELGVTVVPIVSWLSLWGETCDNYHESRRSGDWAYSLNLLPNYGAKYAKKWACWQLWEQKKQPRWRKDVLDGMRFVRDEADCPDICWDQYVLGSESDAELHDLVHEYRVETHEKYPDAIWGGESTLFFEAEADNMDHMFNGLARRGDRWDWDLRPFMYLQRDMRPCITVDCKNPQDARYALMDNALLFVSLPVNGRGEDLRISKYPEVSSAVKACRRIHDRYLDYFLDGIELGDSVLMKDCAGAYVNAYCKDGKLLIFVMKEEESDCTLELNLAPFIGEGIRKAVILDEDNTALSQSNVAADGSIPVSGPKFMLRMIEIG